MRQLTLDMAKRLDQKSLRQIATEVSALSQTALATPLSLQAIMKAFAKIAQPEAPTHPWAVADADPVTLTPIRGAKFSWEDGGAKTFRFATLYRCRIAVVYSGGYAILMPDTLTPDLNAYFSWHLDFDTDYKASVMAYNPYGHSLWSWIKLHTYDNPNPPAPSPGPSPGPQPQPQTYSAIQFYNCDETPPPAGDVEHLPVHFWLDDLTAGTGPQDMGEVPPGYTGPGMGPCGKNYTQPQTYPLISGHQYQYVVVKPDDPDCDGTNDPNGPCRVLGPIPVTGGDTGTLPVQWGPPS
jgi:hypothetical protein